MRALRDILPSRAVMAAFFREPPAIGESVTPFGRDRLNLVLGALTLVIFCPGPVAATVTLIGFWLVTALETRRRATDQEKTI